MRTGRTVYADRRVYVEGVDRDNRPVICFRSNPPLFEGKDVTERRRLAKTMGAFVRVCVMGGE